VRNGTVIDDRWVVPYNPFLLETFDAHINVEVAAHKRCFKYVYAYTAALSSAVISFAFLPTMHFLQVQILFQSA
jgi:hypothetical protein